MTDANATRDRESKRFAYWLLLVCTTAVGAVTFVLSFVGLRDYAERVAGFSDSLAWLVPVGVDGLTLCAVAATMLARNAGWKPRLYTWGVFGIAVLASVAGNLSHATARNLSWAGHIGAAIWPIFLAFASHMLIVVRRIMERPSRREALTDASSPKPQSSRTATTAAPVRDPAMPAVEPAAVAGRPVAPQRRSAPSRKASRPAARAKGDDASKAVAMQRVNAGESVAKVALSLGVHKATVYRWRDEDSRTQTSGDQSADDPKEKDHDLVDVAG
jgi:hypothetical protein